MLDQAEGGDVEAIKARALAHGVSWLAVKTSDGATPYGQIRQLRDLQAPGLHVCSWSYNYGLDVEGEAAAAALALLHGSEGHIFDIESEFSGRTDAAERARFLVNTVRETFLTLPLAYAPLPVIDFWPNLPYETFHELGLPAMPQWYTKALGTGSNYPLSRLVEIWTRWQGQWQHPAPAIYPVLQAYSGEGGGVQTAEMLREEIEAVRQNYQGLSLFRWGAMDEMWEVL